MVVYAPLFWTIRSRLAAVVPPGKPSTILSILKRPANETDRIHMSTGFVEVRSCCRRTNVVSPDWLSVVSAPSPQGTVDSSAQFISSCGEGGRVYDLRASKVERIFCAPGPSLLTCFASCRVYTAINCLNRQVSLSALFSLRTRAYRLRFRIVDKPENRRVRILLVILVISIVSHYT